MPFLDLGIDRDLKFNWMDLLDKTELNEFLGLQVLSIACCVFYSHCGNQVAHHKTTLWSPYPLSQESLKWVAGASEPGSPEGWNMQHVKSQVCWKWLAPVGSAKDYPVFSKWVVYGEVKKHIPCKNEAFN